MKKITIIIIVTLFQFGCAVVPKTEAVQSSADRNEFKGIDKNSKFSISFPSPHSGPYSSIDQFNFQIEDGMYKGYKATAILGKPRKTEVWKVLMVMVNESGNWIELPRTNSLVNVSGFIPNTANCAADGENCKQYNPDL